MSINLQLRQCESQAELESLVRAEQPALLDDRRAMRELHMYAFGWSRANPTIADEVRRGYPTP